MIQFQIILKILTIEILKHKLLLIWNRIVYTQHMQSKFQVLILYIVITVTWKINYSRKLKFWNQIVNGHKN